MVTTIAPTVTPRHASVLIATNVATGMLSNIPKVMAAVTRWTPAQSTVRPQNKRITAGHAATSRVIGQKSWARRAMTGRPIPTEPRNTTASATVVATGWMKYATCSR